MFAYKQQPEVVDGEERRWNDESHAPIPDYLEQHYWWAYVRPWAVHLFEREWLVNLILWGFYKPLYKEVLATWGENLPGRTVQISCCYGNLTPALSQRIDKSGGELTIFDVSHAQLDNISRKLPETANVKIYCRNAEDTGFPTASFDRALLFFLPHEQPEAARRRSIAEAFRMVKPGGSIIVVEFGKPKWWHPLRFIWHPFLYILEPFAPDMWKRELREYFPLQHREAKVEKKSIFWGFYQRLLIHR
jgi:ubiquinone/menaquinone biosynthesis C-methylase UbiE